MFNKYLFKFYLILCCFSLRPIVWPSESVAKKAGISRSEAESLMRKEVEKKSGSELKEKIIPSKNFDSADDVKLILESTSSVNKTKDNNVILNPTWDPPIVSFNKKFKYNIHIFGHYIPMEWKNLGSRRFNFETKK